MSLKQFASLPELLRRLREDLKTAYLRYLLIILYCLLKKNKKLRI